MAKPEVPHVGMQTVVFTCREGDTFQAHGHAAHGPHGHEVRRLRHLLRNGCVVMKLRPGSRKPIRCGAKVTETKVDHPVAVSAPTSLPPSEGDSAA